MWIAVYAFLGALVGTFAGTLAFVIGFRHGLRNPRPTAPVLARAGRQNICFHCGGRSADNSTVIVHSVGCPNTPAAASGARHA